MFATNNNKKYEIQVICVLVVNIDLSISDLSLPAKKIINKNSQSIMKDRQKKNDVNGFVYCGRKETEKI